MEPSVFLKNLQAEDFMMDNNYFSWAYSNILANNQKKKAATTKNKNKNRKKDEGTTAKNLIKIFDHDGRTTKKTTAASPAPTEKTKKIPCKFCRESQCRYKSHLASFQPSVPLDDPKKLTKNNKNVSNRNRSGSGRPLVAVNVYITNQNMDHLGRHDYLKWINDCLATNFGHIEDLKSGAVYCQFMDMLFPGCVPMTKIKFQTICDTDCEDNFELLQTAFYDLQVDKIVPTDKLIQGRFSDNFAFLQWFKKFVMANQNHISGAPYDAIAARQGVPFGVPPRTKNPSEIIWQPINIIPNSNKMSALSGQQQQEEQIFISHRQRGTAVI